MVYCININALFCNGESGSIFRHTIHSPRSNIYMATQYPAIDVGLPTMFVQQMAESNIMAPLDRARYLDIFVLLIIWRRTFIFPQRDFVFSIDVIANTIVV